MNRWGLSQVSDKFAAEFGDWPDSGSLPVERCEAIAFVVANDRAEAEAIVQSMNDLVLEPSSPLGAVARVGDGIAWLGPQPGFVGIAWAGPEGAQP